MIDVPAALITACSVFALMTWFVTGAVVPMMEKTKTVRAASWSVMLVATIGAILEAAAVVWLMLLLHVGQGSWVPLFGLLGVIVNGVSLLHIAANRWNGFRVAATRSGFYIAKYLVAGWLLSQVAFH